MNIFVAVSIHQLRFLALLSDNELTHTAVSISSAYSRHIDSDAVAHNTKNKIKEN